jgi:hypothetical protein
MELTWGQTLRHLLHYLPFQSIPRAKVNVKTHYDIPEELTDAYLDGVYHSYSCALFEEPWRMDPEEGLRTGGGRDDDWDSLERAQHRKVAAPRLPEALARRHDARHRLRPWRAAGAPPTPGKVSAERSSVQTRKWEYLGAGCRPLGDPRGTTVTPGSTTT